MGKRIVQRWWLRHANTRNDLNHNDSTPPQRGPRPDQHSEQQCRLCSRSTWASKPHAGSPRNPIANSGTHREPHRNPCTDCGTNTHPVTDTDSHTDRNPCTDCGTNTYPNSDTDSHTDRNPCTDCGTNTYPNRDTDSHTDRNTYPNRDTDSHTNTDTATFGVSVTDTDSDANTDTDSDANTARAVPIRGARSSAGRYGHDARDGFSGTRRTCRGAALLRGG